MLFMSNAPGCLTVCLPKGAVSTTGPYVNIEKAGKTLMENRNLNNVI